MTNILLIGAALAGIGGIMATVVMIYLFLLIRRDIGYRTPVDGAPEPKGKKVIVPGEGIFTLHNKRKVKVIDERKAWQEEQRRDE